MVDTLLVSVLSREPSLNHRELLKSSRSSQDTSTHGRLLEDEEQWDHDSDWDELETDRDSPRDIALRVHEGHTVVDPETESDSNDNDNLEETRDSASDPPGGDLTSVGWANYGNNWSTTIRKSGSANDSPTLIRPTPKPAVNRPP